VEYDDEDLIDKFMLKVSELPSFDFFIKGYPLRFYQSMEELGDWIKNTLINDPSILNFGVAETTQKIKQKDLNYFA